MTPHSALAVLGAISLFVLVTTTIVRGLSSLASDRRARHATQHLVGRTYWSPDADALEASWLSYRPTVLAEAPRLACGTQRLPRCWRPSGRVIDVEVR